MRIQWINRTDGTGAIIGTHDLGYDDDASGNIQYHSTFRVLDEGPLVKYVVQTFYWHTDPTTEAEVIAARAAAMAYLDDLKATLRYREPVVRDLARGRVHLPNIHQNFGELVVSGTGAATLLTNCTLFDAQVTDDVGIHGIGIELTFGRASDAVISF